MLLNPKLRQCGCAAFQAEYEGSISFTRSIKNFAPKSIACGLRPSFWIYSENDSYFGPELVRQMFSNYNSSGGKATLHILPPNPAGWAMWAGLLRLGRWSRSTAAVAITPSAT
ncbi:hypothetical protein ABIF70_005175 [Bradyrhizobium japonicum]